MRLKSFAIFVTVWSLVTLPALCVGGWIGHVCACDHEEPCSHEVDCADDPCSSLSATAAGRSAGYSPLLIGLSPHLGVDPVSHASPHSESDTPLFLHMCDRPRIRCAPSDLPLLI